ncbi:Caspase recruitment domain-containing protein 18 Caspase-1 inhibitor Iceberg [Xyrichtys novacula]|uniref:Caspase recruitment domain-containing protein 18 Caspase-1 inhibitor Iceberg n=1 Tax=Xyrichtys novacula TaxID=13765 RepID=A0AAV1FCY7_XYRNO|nr:Caspase recruitment domain-containing protein 18 Caspase-1 inhibitor Iceberg [Xyrichtys novacula]
MSETTGGKSDSDKNTGLEISRPSEDIDLTNNEEKLQQWLREYGDQINQWVEGDESRLSPRWFHPGQNENRPLSPGSLRKQMLFRFMAESYRRSCVKGADKAEKSLRLNDLADPEHLVEIYKYALSQGVNIIKPILDKLLVNEIIQEETYDQISTLPAPEDKMRMIYDRLSAEDGGIDIFNNILAELEQQFHKDSESQKQQSAASCSSQGASACDAMTLSSLNPAKTTGLEISLPSEERARMKILSQLLQECGDRIDEDESRFSSQWYHPGQIVRRLGSLFNLSRNVEHLVEIYKYALSQGVNIIKPILDKLLMNEIIQEETYDQIGTLPTPEDKMRMIYDHMSAEDGGIDTFNNILAELEPQFHKDSESQKQQSAASCSSQGASACDAMTMANTACTESQMPLSEDWHKVEPEVDPEEPETFCLQSEGGKFECCASGLRWVCKKNISFKLKFGSWEEHMEKLEMLHFLPAGPLLDISVIAGQFEEVYLPHWICVDDDPPVLDEFAVLHVDTCGDFVEKVFAVTPSHVKLSHTDFSPKGVLMRVGLPVKYRCKMLIFKTSKAFLTLHAYLIPRDPALAQLIKKNELSSGSKMIQKPYPEKSLKMCDNFTLAVDKDTAKVFPEKLRLLYESTDPNFFEVFIANPDQDLLLTLKHESTEVWTCAIRQNDYQSTGYVDAMYDKELARLRRKLVQKLSEEVIHQLLDDLFADGVLNDEEKDSIFQKNNTRADRARCLIDTVRNKGQKASRKMIDHLEHRDPTVFTELGLPTGSPV